MACANCGASHHKRDAFCTYCGIQLAGTGWRIRVHAQQHPPAARLRGWLASVRTGMRQRVRQVARSVTLRLR